MQQSSSLNETINITPKSGQFGCGALSKIFEFCCNSARWFFAPLPATKYAHCWILTSPLFTGPRLNKRECKQLQPWSQYYWPLSGQVNPRVCKEEQNFSFYFIISFWIDIINEYSITINCLQTVMNPNIFESGSISDLLFKPLGQFHWMFLAWEFPQIILKSINI